MTRSFVYFAQALDGGPIKIGCTQNPHMRMKMLRAKGGAPVWPLALVSGSLKDEAQLHWKFRHLRIRGEWYTPGLELLAFIATLPPFLGGMHSVPPLPPLAELPPRPVGRRAKPKRHDADAVEVIRAFGGQTALAGEIGLATNVVGNWRARGIPLRWRINLVRLANERGIAIPDLLKGIIRDDQREAA